jgi:hypothetical protein
MRLNTKWDYLNGDVTPARTISFSNSNHYIGKSRKTNSSVFISVIDVPKFFGVLYFLLKVRFLSLLLVLLYVQKFTFQRSSTFNTKDFN